MSRATRNKAQQDKATKRTLSKLSDICWDYKLAQREFKRTSVGWHVVLGKTCGIGRMNRYLLELFRSSGLKGELLVALRRKFGKKVEIDYGCAGDWVALRIRK